jgi:hypothetical protein
MMPHWSTSLCLSKDFSLRITRNNQVKRPLLPSYGYKVCKAAQDIRIKLLKLIIADQADSSQNSSQLI